MKNVKKALITLLSAMVLCVTFLFATACGKVEGTYKFSKLSYTSNGLSVEYKVGDTLLGIIPLDEEFFQITFNEDGTVSILSKDDGVQTGTWEKDGNKVLITGYLGGTIEAELSGKTLTFTTEYDVIGEIAITLEK